MLQKLFFFGVLTIILAAPAAAYACRCKMPSTAWAYKKAEMVIFVKAQKVEKLTEETESVELSVSAAWKQNAAPTLKILAGGKVCGYFFEEGKDYIVYLKKNNNGEWTTVNCVGNKVINDAKLPLITELAKQDKIWLKKNGKKGLVE